MNKGVYISNTKVASQEDIRRRGTIARLILNFDIRPRWMVSVTSPTALPLAKAPSTASHWVCDWAGPSFREKSLVIAENQTTKLRTSSPSLFSHCIDWATEVPTYNMILRSWGCAFMKVLRVYSCSLFRLWSAHPDPTHSDNDVSFCQATVPVYKTTRWHNADVRGVTTYY